MNQRKVFLVLDDGDCYEGVGCPQQMDFPERAGEVVFNTTHSGYEEIATDPSYLNQIIVMTAPMQGNYGSDKADWESSKIWINGFVCLQLQNSVRNSSWADLLVKNKIPILTEIDTRKLTIRLRNQGTPWGTLVSAESSEVALQKAQELIRVAKKVESDWVWIASRKNVEHRIGKNPKGPRVAVLDFGSKENILRELETRCSEIKIFPSRTPFDVIQAFSPDALMLTNGPGDPAAVEKAPETIRHFLGKIPVFGICMGHQVLSLAMGAKTYKLKFGHRGANHTIKDSLLNKIYMSSQNHGYAVDEKTLPSDVRVTHTNLNDKTVAGFYSEKLNCLGIQYHPESHPGPHDAVLLFDYFINVMNKKNMNGNKNDKPINL